MNPDQILAHLKRLTSTLSPSQLATLVGVFLAVVGVLVGTTYWISAPTYTVLFSDLDSESASSVVSRLKTEKIQYQLDEGGRTVRVPSQRLDELRLEFSSQGMPASGRIGFEIFDRTAFGTTEFLEHVNYRRALEGELARTIGTIGEVASARVHIAMAKESLFATQTAPAKASVVLKLKGRKPLAPQTINAITGLVASSVEDLRPESVVVLDTFGRSLTPKTDSDDEATGLHLDQQHRLERELTTKVVSLLEPIVGEGRVRVNVAARLDADSAEETEERWDPTTVLRSKQTSSDVGATPAGYAAASIAAVPGVAGARANTPPPLPATAATATTSTVTPIPAGGPPSRTTESANFEVSKLTRHTITPSGQIARLSVAVVVDDDRSGAPGAGGEAPAPKPRTPEEIERLHKLVAAAVGFEEERGDQLTVENISFEETTTAAPVEAPQTALQKITTVVQSNQMQELGRALGVILLAILAFFLFLKPVMNKALTAETRMSLPAVPGAGGGMGGLPTVGSLEQQVEGARELRKLPALTRTVSKLAEDEPESVARLVRSWIADND